MNGVQTVVVLSAVILFSCVGAIVGVQIAPQLLPQFSSVSDVQSAGPPALIYDLMNIGSKAIRLDRVSGDLLTIDDEGIYLFSQADLTFNKILDLAFSDVSQALQSKNEFFPPSDGTMWARIQYKHLGNKLRYRYEFGPYVEAFGKAIRESPSIITLYFSDSDDFVLISADIALRSGTRIQGDGDKVLHMRYDGEMECSDEVYALITNAAIRWRFDESVEKALSDAREAAQGILDSQRAELEELIAAGIYTGHIVGNIFIVNTVSSGAAASFSALGGTEVYPWAWPGLIEAGRLRQSLVFRQPSVDGANIDGREVGGSGFIGQEEP